MITLANRNFGDLNSPLYNVKLPNYHSDQSKQERNQTSETVYIASDMVSVPCEYKNLA